MRIATYRDDRAGLGWIGVGLHRDHGGTNDDYTVRSSQLHLTWCCPQTAYLLTRNHHARSQSCTLDCPTPRDPVPDFADRDRRRLLWCD
ncbi:MAG: hypothetical protein HC795_19005 [Coleofasciculaceae cyanobacterium RL_1_1]|nr:hypothetical protein [Coleofasciculaceae cyanobacterium RL_1_1]